MPWNPMGGGELSATQSTLGSSVTSGPNAQLIQIPPQFASLFGGRTSVPVWEITNLVSRQEANSTGGNLLKTWNHASPAYAENQLINQAANWGREQGIIRAPDNSFGSLLRDFSPALIAGGAFLGGLGGAGATGGSAPAGGAATGSGTAGGLGGGSTVGGAFGGTGLGGTTGVGGIGLSGAGGSIGTGGLGTGVGIGAGTEGTLLGSGMTSGPAAGLVTGGSASTSSGLSGLLDKVFGPAAGSAVGGSLASNLFKGGLGQGLLDLYASGQYKNTANTAAGLADPFASQRPQYQAQLSNLMLHPETINQDPAYQFRLKSGQQALERSDAAKGYLNSGNIMYDLMNYGQGAASQELGNQRNLLAQLSGSSFGPGTAATNYQTGMNQGLAQQYQGIGALGTAGRTLWDNRNNLSNLFSGTE